MALKPNYFRLGCFGREKNQMFIVYHEIGRKLKKPKTSASEFWILPVPQLAGLFLLFGYFPAPATPQDKPTALGHERHATLMLIAGSHFSAYEIYGCGTLKF